MFFLWRISVYCLNNCAVYKFYDTDVCNCFCFGDPYQWYPLNIPIAKHQKQYTRCLVYMTGQKGFLLTGVEPTQPWDCCVISDLGSCDQLLIVKNMRQHNYLSYLHFLCLQLAFCSLHAIAFTLWYCFIFARCWLIKVIQVSLQSNENVFVITSRECLRSNEKRGTCFHWEQIQTDFTPIIIRAFAFGRVSDIRCYPGRYRPPFTFPLFNGHKKKQFRARYEMHGRVARRISQIFHLMRTKRIS